MKQQYFIPFAQDVRHLSRPERFTFPFFYTPHPLAREAALELQHKISAQENLGHNFGMEGEEDPKSIGKMFGVLVVQNQEGTMGYLAAVSGKLANSNQHEFLVPPIFDTLLQDGLFKTNESTLNLYNKQIDDLQQHPHYLELIANLKDLKHRISREREYLQRQIKEGKIERDRQRSESISVLPPHELDALEHTLSEQSRAQSIMLKHKNKEWKKEIAKLEESIQHWDEKITSLKQKRKNLSNHVQHYLHDQYRFLNAHGHAKGLMDIFREAKGTVPPAGSGECAAPKLLQYAYRHQLHPVCMAEFWWGQSPKTQIRKHGNFYPSCRSKCEPILGHMLEGLTLDPNPIQSSSTSALEIEIIYEDTSLLVINKPPELLSVPGKSIQDCVYNRIKDSYPRASGPLVVHRLDMSTSGLMVIPLAPDAHKRLQWQFIHRKVSKRYVALLDGILHGKEGQIELPLRVDLDNRPQQMVCYEHGRAAVTRWQLVATEGGQSRVHFHPITGRTHQLRVHAAHPDGLNTPIVGDDLYGSAADRLHLHAESLQFYHPSTRQPLSFVAPAPF